MYIMYNDICGVYQRSIHIVLKCMIRYDDEGIYNMYKRGASSAISQSELIVVRRLDEAVCDGVLGVFDESGHESATSMKMFGTMAMQYGRCCPQPDDGYSPDTMWPVLGACGGSFSIC